MDDQNEINKTEKEALAKAENEERVHNEKKMKRHKWGFRILGVSILFFLVFSFFTESTFKWGEISLFILIILLLVSAILIFDFSRILFDPQEYTPNAHKRAIIRKIRYRAVLFNNIAILLFLLTVVIIVVCLYLFFVPSLSSTGDDKYWINNLTVRVGISVLLIFLVQILFKVFKYLLRVAAFYNARADAIEFILIDQKGDMEKLVDLFTPEKYDISELEKISLWESLTNIIKAKSGTPG